MALNKAAMFGLDARIALAIFGSLSVISGAALYGAIQKSKVVSYVNLLNEGNKALEAYIVDTGINIPFSTSAANIVLKTEELVNSAVNGWKGPYLSNAVVDDSTLRFEKTNILQLWQVRNQDWVLPFEVLTTEKCTAGDANCYYWFVIGTVSTDMSNAIDEYVDGTAGRLTGRLRAVYHNNDTSSTKSHVFLQGPRTL